MWNRDHEEKFCVTEITTTKHGEVIERLPKAIGMQVGPVKN